ncbi:MAG: PIN domain-containing protein [Chloroflexi bacterium]|nr:PIN domain-containing protein [Chloroflexota bacterium]
MGLTILDASVVIALLDRDDALHHASVAAVLRADGLGLPASALTESMVAPHRRGVAREMRSLLDDMAVSIEPLTESMADRAASMRAREASMRLGDALVLATAEILGAERILTGDRRWLRWSELVELVEA